jgi:hypothetical protein
LYLPTVSRVVVSRLARLRPRVRSFSALCAWSSGRTPTQPREDFHRVATSGGITIVKSLFKYGKRLQRIYFLSYIICNAVISLEIFTFSSVFSSLGMGIFVVMCSLCVNKALWPRYSNVNFAPECKQNRVFHILIYICENVRLCFCIVLIPYISPLFSLCPVLFPFFSPSLFLSHP